MIRRAGADRAGLFDTGRRGTLSGVTQRAQGQAENGDPDRPAIGGNFAYQ